MKHLSITTVGTSIAALVVVAFALPAAVWAQGSPNHPEASWEMMHDWGWGSGWMWLMPLFGIAWFALLVVVIVLVVRWLGGGNGDRGASARSARDILDERYARGEIDREEYLQRRNDIAGGVIGDLRRPGARATPS
jgi:putative membrane protein